MVDENLEFERRQLEHLIGKAGWAIIEGQSRNGHVVFKVKKLKAKWR